MVSSVTGRLAGNISSAILNQNDPETVREGAPAYLILIDGLINEEPEEEAPLSPLAHALDRRGSGEGDPPDPEMTSEDETKAPPEAETKAPPVDADEAESGTSGDSQEELRLEEAERDRAPR